MDFDLATGTAVLARTPETLRVLLAGLPPAWTDADEGPETWSPAVVVAHLVHAERTNWIPRASVILAEGGERRFPPFDRFAQLTWTDGAPLEARLDEFARLRAASLETLAAWRPGDAELARTGVHPEFGAVTLRQLLATWVAHDLAHLGQVARVMAKQYRDAVGPWRAFLPILDR